MEALLIRFDAPLMSFGAPIVDHHGVIQPFPALSMLCGMLGNALGYHHRDTDALQCLQERIRYACRRDVPGRRLRDFQTVHLGQPFMRDHCAWTTRGALEKRKGGSASTGTHIRLRDYWAEAACTVALALAPPDESPGLQDLERALDRPERPLFIGRKCCLPAGRLLLGRVEADSLLDALRSAPLPCWAERRSQVDASWPTRPDADDPGAMQPFDFAQGGEPVEPRPVTDARDWANQIHVGERWLAQGKIQLEPEESAND
ncbi:MAG: type I-E CRISPR-associated protein Cas5/CasD [Candidatus Brocadiia bacterium]